MRCCLLLLAHAIWPATQQYQIDHWTTENGLPIGGVTGICQTREGYLWIATLDGLARFDGVRFTIFNRSNTAGITSNRFGTMFCAVNADFWTGTEGGTVIRYHDGRFQSYSTKDGLASGPVLGISGDDHGNIWVLAPGGISRWLPAQGKFARFDDHENPYAAELWSNDRRHGFFSMDSSRLHIFSAGKQTSFPFPEIWRKTSAYIAMQESDGSIWIANSAGRLVHWLNGRWVEQTKGEVSEYRDSRGRRWRTGLRMSAQGFWERYLVLPAGTEPGDLPYSFLFEDHEGNLWAGNVRNGEGLFRLRERLLKAFSTEQGLPNRNVYPIYQSRDGAIWIGTWSGGLCRFEGGKCRTYTTSDGLATNMIYAIGEDAKGTLWVSTEGALHRFKKNRFERVDLDMGARAIHKGRDGALWLGNTEGLFRFKDGQWRRFNRQDGLIADDVRIIIDDGSDGLWTGGYGGLCHMRGGKFQCWSEADGLPGNSIRALYQDANRVLWIGTYDAGLGRLANGRFTRYTTREGLFDNGVFQTLEDSEGNLWMSSNRGIYRVRKRELNDFAAGKIRTIHSVNYGRSDGMRNVECNGGTGTAGIKAEDGSLWFATQDGVAIIRPSDADAVIARPPPAIVESCMVDHRLVPADRTIRMRPGQLDLECQYTALSFVDSERIVFRYKLSGLDENWVDAGTRRAAYYSHVPPGKYTFQVEAAYDDRAWSNSGVHLAVIVLPPFYQTWWFETIVFLAAAGAIYLAWRKRVSQLEQARDAQQAFSRQLIASQENERKRIAAELHDSLGQHLVVIKSLALISLNNGISEGAGKDRSEEISAEASQALSQVREIAYNLRPYQLDRIGLTKAVEAVVRKASAATGIAFESEIDRIDDVFPKEWEINFYRIVQESVNNVIKHSQATQASVTVRRATDELRLVVRDNGNGFTPVETTVGSARGGFGLIGIAERARLLQGTAKVQSAPGQGTAITIEIPLERNRNGR
ncbi:MAG: two-component regulator propeller domain-containing protein [Bryobacteraceae bacterium]